MASSARKRTLAALASTLVTAACGNPAATQMKAYEESRVAGELSDYEAARSAGRALDMCVKAGQIVAAYTQTGSPNRIAWETRRADDCRAAEAKIAPPPAR